MISVCTNKKIITKLVSIVFLIGFISIVNAQNNVDRNEMIGFSCGWAGTPSETVETFTTKLISKNYDWIAKQLTSKNTAYKYMSVITLEKLIELGTYTLNDTQLKLIVDIKKSSELVTVCSGCTYFQKVEMKHMFTVKMMTVASGWLNYNF